MAALAHGGRHTVASVPLGLVEQLDRTVFDTPTASSFMRPSAAQQQRPKDAAGEGAGLLPVKVDLQREPARLQLEAPSLRVESVGQRHARLSWEPVAWHSQLPAGTSIAEDILLREVRYRERGGEGGRRSLRAVVLIFSWCCAGHGVASGVENAAEGEQ
jgi:hypothetical protein